MIDIKTAISKFFELRKHSILPAAMMPWRSTISIPRERMTLAVQFEKLVAINDRATPDSTRLAKMQVEAVASLETASFAFDRVLEDLAALNLTMPSLAAYICPIAPSLSVQVATPPAADDADHIKRAA